MQKILITLALVVLTAGPLAASENTRVMATVNQLVDAFNKGDTRSLKASCTDQMCIIDEFSPYEWHGAGTCSKWLADYDADVRQNGISDGKVTIGKPLARRRCRRSSLCCRPSELHIQAEGEIHEGDGFDMDIHTAESRGWLAGYRMGLGKALSASLA